MVTLEFTPINVSVLAMFATLLVPALAVAFVSGLVHVLIHLFISRMVGLSRPNEDE